MQIRKAVVTAAGRDQRALPLQTLVDRDGAQKSALEIIIDEIVSAGVQDIAVVIYPGDEAAYAKAAPRANLTLIPQESPRGYGHALACAREFCGGEPFLHLVGDHLWVSHSAKRCAEQLIQVAQAEACAVSAVQATRESNLPYYGTVGGRLVAGSKNLYEIETVLEKPTPTQAEQQLMVPGLRAGHYLCFFGIHVLTPAIMGLLAEELAAAPGRPVSLSPSLAELARREKYLALELAGRRYNIGERYGLFAAQLALALEGREREEVLAQIVELLAQRELVAEADGGTAP